MILIMDMMLDSWWSWYSGSCVALQAWYICCYSSAFNQRLCFELDGLNEQDVCCWAGQTQTRSVMIWMGYKTVNWAEKEISAFSNVFLRFIILYFNYVYLNFTMIIIFLTTIIMLLMSISLGLNAAEISAMARMWSAAACMTRIWQAGVSRPRPGWWGERGHDSVW